MTAAVTEHPHSRLLPAAEVERARQALRDDAAELCTVQTRTVEFDDGTTRTFTAPAPLALIEQEVHAVIAPVGSFNPRSKPPAGIDALTLLAAIDTLTVRPPDRDRTEWVWSWVQTQSSSAPGHVVDAAKVLGEWRGTAQRLLDPPPAFRLRGQACPSCHAEKVWDRDGAEDEAGERHARPALEVDSHRGVAVCRWCSAQWPPELWEHLRAVLEQQQAETLAVDGWDPAVTARTVSEASVAKLASLTAHGHALAAAASHTPRLNLGDAPVQCAARVPQIADGEPVRRAGALQSKRCPALLDASGTCALADRHLDAPARDDDQP